MLHQRCLFNQCRATAARDGGSILLDELHMNFSSCSNVRRAHAASKPQIRFIEMVIDQLTARGVMPAAALYEAPFSNLHAGGPDELFAGKDNVIAGIFDALNSVQPKARNGAG